MPVAAPTIKMVSILEDIVLGRKPVRYEFVRVRAAGWGQQWLSHIIISSERHAMIKEIGSTAKSRRSAKETDIGHQNVS